MNRSPLFAICLLACSSSPNAKISDKGPVDSAADSVESDPPVAVIEASTLSGAFPLDVSFSALPSEGDGLTYAWDLGDGESETTMTVARTWLGSGTRTVSLTVTDERGETATDSVEVEVVLPDCPVGGEQEVLGTVTEPILDEISGVGVSRQNPGVLWVHNDARNARALYAVDETGEGVGAYDLDINYGDWEDIAVGVDELGDPVLYVGSVGNNDLDRLILSILIVPEPVVPLGTLTVGTVEFREMQLEYPDGPYDSESLMWDPQTGDLYVITKDISGESHVFRAAAPHDEESVMLEEVALLDFSVEPLSGLRTTAATISPLGDLIAIRTYSSTAYVWRRDASQPLADAFAGEPCPVTIASEPQGESLDFSLDGRSLLSIPEGVDPDVNRTALVDPA